MQGVLLLVLQERRVCSQGENEARGVDNLLY